MHAVRGIGRRLAVAALVLLPALAAVLAATPLRAETVTVFAAASTTTAVDAAIERFTNSQGIKVRASYAGSSTLAKQIAHGAPAQVYISANPQWMDYLEQEGRIVPGSRSDLLSNRLVLIVPADSPLKLGIEPGFDLAGALGDRRLAVGDPDHVPAGMYAKEALRHLGVWESLSGKLAPMPHVRTALMMVERGEASAGIVYSTDAAISEKVRVVDTFPAESHRAIIYPAALVAGQESEAARRFLAFLGSSEGRDIFRHHGFLPAGTTIAGR